MKQLRPMKAADYTGKFPLQFPLMATPKLDGVRALVHGGKVLSNSLKMIPNRFVQELFGRPELDGLDGELIVGWSTAPDVFRKTTSGVMCRDGTPDVRFYVFDSMRRPEEPSSARFTDVLMDCVAESRVVPLHPSLVESKESLNSYEQICLEQGYEGVMLRHPDSPYKFGRATEKQGWLLKLKRFTDAEATVTGAEEMMHNYNEASLDERGLTKRSHAKEGMRPAGVLGKLVCTDAQGREFRIGSGFTAQLKKDLWETHQQGKLVGQVVTYKFQDHGVKDAPRIPIFKGVRHPIDISP